MVSLPHGGRSAQPRSASTNLHGRIRLKVSLDMVTQFLPFLDLLWASFAYYYYYYYFFFGHPMAFGFSGPGIRSEPQLQPTPQRQQCWILSPLWHSWMEPPDVPLIQLHHRRNSILWVFLFWSLEQRLGFSWFCYIVVVIFKFILLRSNWQITLYKFEVYTVLTDTFIYCNMITVLLLVDISITSHNDLFFCGNK